MARWQDQGESWQTGAALSSGDPADLIWDECTLTEMRNGSVLMSARIDDPKNTDPHHPDTNATRVGTSRGFARSDDGASTELHDMYTIAQQLAPRRDQADQTRTTTSAGRT